MKKVLKRLASEVVWSTGLAIGVVGVAAVALGVFWTLLYFFTLADASVIGSGTTMQAVDSLGPAWKILGLIFIGIIVLFVSYIVRRAGKKLNPNVIQSKQKLDGDKS